MMQEFDGRWMVDVDVVVSKRVRTLQRQYILARQGSTFASREQPNNVERAYQHNCILLDTGSISWVMLAGSDASYSQQSRCCRVCTPNRPRNILLKINAPLAPRGDGGIWSGGGQIGSRVSIRD